MMNSLPGRFGMKGQRWEKVKQPESPAAWGRFDDRDAATGAWNYYRSMAWMTEKYVENPVAKESFPAVSAWTCSLARVKMLELLGGISHAGKVYYSAVDSVCGGAAIKSAIESIVPLGDQLGNLRCAHIVSSAEFRGIANYSLDGEMHVAGLPAAAVIRGDGRANITDFAIPSTGFSGKHVNGITECHTDRNLYPPYLHGVIEASGWTRPWILPLEELEMTKCLQKAIPTLFTT